MTTPSFSGTADLLSPKILGEMKFPSFPLKSCCNFGKEILNFLQILLRVVCLMLDLHEFLELEGLRHRFDGEKYFYTIIEGQKSAPPGMT